MNKTLLILIGFLLSGCTSRMPMHIGKNDNSNHSRKVTKSAEGKESQQESEIKLASYEKASNEDAKEKYLKAFRQVLDKASENHDIASQEFTISLSPTEEGGWFANLVFLPKAPDNEITILLKPEDLK